MRNDSLDDLSLKPSRDDLAQRQHTRGTKPAPAGKAPAPTVAANTAPLWSLVILLVVVMAGGGWYLWDQVQRLQNNLHQSLAALNQSEQALSSLQQNLDNRDKTLSKSGDQMQAELKELNSEVRKLWDLTNKRQKAELEQQAKALAALEASLKSQGVTFDKQSQSTLERVTKLREEWQQLKDGQAALQASLEEQKAALEKQNSELAKLRTSLATPDDLDTRMTNVEVALKSIDAYRRQVNTRLDQLDEQLGQLYNSPVRP